MSLFSDKLLEAGQQAQWNSPVYDTQGVAPHYDVEKDEDAGTISKLGHRLLGGLEGFGGDALKGIGTYLDYLDEKGRDSSYIDSIRDSDGGYLKDAGDWFINNGQYLSNDATTMRQKYGSGDKYADKSLGELLTDPDYLFSSDGAIGDAMEGLGSTLPFIALNYLIPGSGLVSRGLKGASGLDRIIYGLAKTPEARKEAMKILATGEGRETLAGLARQQGLNAGDNAARRAAMWALDKGAGTAGDNALKWAYSAGPMDALTNAAGMYDDLKEQGYSYEDMVKAMGESAKEELPLDMLNMALFGTVTKGTVGNLLKGTAKPKKIIGNLLGLPIEGLSEDYQEAMQQRLNNKYTGKEYGTWDNPTPDEAAAGAQGFIGSLLPGAFGTGMGIRHSFKGQDDRATRIGTAWDNIRSLNGEPPTTNSAMDMIAEANASTEAKLAADNAAAQKAAEQASQPAFAVAQDEQAQESAGSGSLPTYDQKFYTITDEVRDTNLDADTEARLNILAHDYQAQFGEPLQVTSMKRNGGGGSWHDSGQAFDVAGGGLESNENGEREWLMQRGQELGLTPLDEYAHPSKHATGLHIHFSNHEDGSAPSLGDVSTGNDAGGGLTLSSGDEQIDAWIQEAADANGVPANLLSALLDVESGYNVDTPNSEAGAIGIAQFMPGTAEAMGIDPRDPHQAISGAARLLKQEYDHYGNWSQALEAYNGGEGNVGSGETQAYAQKVLGKAGDISHVGGGPRSSASTNFLNEKPSFDINSDDAEGRKMISDFIDYWGNRANVDDADTIQGMLDANGKFRNTQENRNTVREKWGDELQQYADEHMPDEQQQARQETQAQKQAQQQADAARRAAQGSKKATSASTKAAIDTSTPSLDAAKQQQVSTTPQATSIDTAGESEQTQAEPAQSLPNTAHLQPNTEHPASETAHPATAQANAPAQAKAQQAQPTTQASQPTAQAAPIEQAKAQNVPKNEPQNAQQNSQAPAQPQTPTMDAQQATKQQNALPQPAQTPQQATAQMSPAQQRARAAKEQRLQKELETNATLDQIERGQQLEAAAKQASVALPQGMAGALHRGQAPAIAQATELLQQKGVSLPTVEASGSTVYGKAESNNGWGSTERARFHRKLKKARAGLKKQKPKSKDERELVNSIDKAYQDIQDALEGLKNGTMSAKDAGHLIWKRHGEVASKWQNTKNKKRYLGTRGAYENAFNDATTEVHYASVEAGEDNSRSTEEPTVDPVTSKQVMQGYRDAIDETVDDYYKGELTAEESHIEMERTLEKAQGEPESRAREEDQQAFDEYVTQKENEVAEDNRQKLDGHMRERNEAKSQAKEAVANGGRGNSAQDATAPRKVEPAENASGQQMEKPSSKKSTPSRKPVKGKAGKSVTVTTDSGKELHARYRIVPASSLTTSNVYDGDTIAKNDAYPQELQPRERSGRKEMQAQTDGMAADLHPADLESSRNLNQGAPLIRSDGVVLNGNGRTMAITRAYALRNKAGKRYTQYLIEHAEDFGFTKDQMRAAVKAKGTGKPVLVRELTDDADEATTQDIINSKTGGARMSATEQAETDAKSITSRDFDGYDAESDGDLTKAGNDGFVAKLLRKLVGKDEINAYTDANGSVNQDGYRRVKRAIFSRAYGDTDLIAKMAESMDDAIKNISNGLQSAAANVARLNLKMQEGNAYSYPLADTIARAVKKYNAIKEGKAEANVEAYASENATSLTGGDPEAVVKLVQALDDYHRSGKKVGIFLNRLARLIDGMGSPKEDENALFAGGEAEPRTLAALIDRAKELTDTKGEQNLFGTPKYSIAYHGTAADFDKFDVGQIGTGEGSQAHGWGLYFAKDRSVSEGYKSLLVSQVDEVKINSETYHREHRDYAPDAILDSHGKEVTDDGLRIAAGQLLWNNGDKAKALKTLEEYSDLDGYKDAANILRTGDVAAVEKKGTLAEVEVPEDDVMLDEQKTLDKQPETVREALSKLAITDKTLTGKDAYEKLSRMFISPRGASRALNKLGVKGIKYHGENDGDCYVVFDDKAVSIIRKLSASRAKEAHARAIEDIKAEVMKAFPGAKDVKDTEGRITFTMPNGAKVAIRIHDNMTVTGEEASRARRAHGIADGVTITVNGSAYTIGRQAVIDLSQRGEVGTVYHEALHVAMDLLFDDKTKAALMKKYGSEEKIADAYRKFMLAEARGGHVPFGKPLRAIRDFFRALAAHIAPIRKACGDAWTAQKAFEDLASGKAWEPASKKSHGFSLFSHAEAAERPIDNEAARGDNEVKKENQRIEQKNQKVFESVQKAFLNEVQKLRDKGWKETSIARAMNDENSAYRKAVVEPFARVYNQFHVKGSNKRDVVQRILGEKAFADLMQKNPTRRQEAIAEVFQQLSDRMEGVMNDARKTCIELADRFGNGQDVAGLHSWRDIEASSRKHHGGAAFTEHPAEVNHEQHHSVSRSETQDGFSDARKSDEEYLAAVDRYENAKTDEERAHALDDLRTMVQEAADAAGFHDAVPEQTVAYHTREGAAPKKTIKVYKVFTVSPDGSPTALFIGGTEKLPQGVWLDAQSAYHFQAANGKYYVPSTQNPYTKGGKTGVSVEIPNEQVRQELIERGFLKPGSTAKKITALAYRPGWHAGTLPFFPQGGKKDASANYGMVHRENQVVFECELAADKNYTQEARSQEKAKTKAGKLNLKNADLQYMPENGFYFYATNPLTQSHPELGAWAISGSLKINRALSQEECDRILEKNGMKPQAWEQGKMNLQDLGYTGEQNDAARKTLAPITYDDSGNVIPLSERFNPEKHDIRYSISEGEARLAKAQTMDDLNKATQKVFPGSSEAEHTTRENDDGTTQDIFKFRLANGTDIEIHTGENINLPEREKARARREHGIDEGRDITVNGMEQSSETTITVNGRTVTKSSLARIVLSKFSDFTSTLYHEAFHVAYDLFLTNKEKAAIEHAYSEKAKAADMTLEEYAADRYRDWARAKLKGLHVAYGKIWQKVSDGAEKTVEYMEETEETARIFREIESGKIWERPLDRATRERDNEVKEDFLNEVHEKIASLDSPTDDELDNVFYKSRAAREARADFNFERRNNADDAFEASRVFDMLGREFEDDETVKRIRDRNGGRSAASSGRVRGENAEETSKYAARGSRGEVEGSDSGRVPVSSSHPSVLKQREGKAIHDYYNDHKAAYRDRQQNNEGRPNEGGLLRGENTETTRSNIHYSAEEAKERKSVKDQLHKVSNDFAKKVHLKGDDIMAEEDQKPRTQEDITSLQATVLSPSRVASKVKTFRVIYSMADRAMNKLVTLRNDFGRKYDAALSLVKSKDDRTALFDMLLRGDAEGKEWTRQELLDEGVKENVADAYIQIRRQLNKAYHLVNNARRAPVGKSETVDGARLEELRHSNFVDDLSVTDKGNGKYLVSYKEYRNYPTEHKGVDAEAVEAFRKNPGMDVVDVVEAGEDGEGRKLYDVKTLEGPADLHKLTGYIPHFFHEYLILAPDGDGMKVVGSGRTQREAIQKAEAYKKEHPLGEGEVIRIRPKTFNINEALGISEDEYLPIVGDKDFRQVQENLAKQNDMTLDEAKDMLDGTMRRKGRHRFFGNALHRKGAEGFETDLNWALRHYFNSASRYVAMETEFKPKAISFFERVFGAFDKDYKDNALARYCKDYINDINGNPSALEQRITKLLTKEIPGVRWMFKNVITPTFGDRAALTLGNSIANKVSYLTLGLNMSSALLNFTQLMNSAAYLGDARTLITMVAKGLPHRKHGKEPRYSMHELRVLHEAGVFNDIGLDSGSGYDKMRGGGETLGAGRTGRTLARLNSTMDYFGSKSMRFFQEADAICRRGTVLAAYEKARKEGKSHAEAIAYARDINYKANFQYGVQDAANIFRRGSILSQMLLQFKKYGMKELEVMHDFTFSNKTSKKQKLLFWGMYAMLCGAMGIPALDWLDDILGEKLGWAYPKDAIQKFFINNFPKPVAKMLMYGGAAVLNANLSNRAGLSDVIPTSLGDFAGPTLSKSARFISDLHDGAWANALRDVSPGLYNMYAAGTGESRGKRDRLNDRYVTAWDRILRAVGFRSVDETIPTDMQRIISRDKAAATKERQEAQDAYIQNPTSENKQRLKDLGIKEKDVQKEATKKNQTREERTQGTVPKKDKDKYKSLTDFMKE